MLGTIGKVGLSLGALSSSSAALAALMPDYITALTSAGATLSGTELAVLNAELLSLESHSVYAKLKELWVPVSSSSAGAYVKLLSATGAINPMTTTAAPTYNRSTGMLGVSASSTNLHTGMTPVSAGFSERDWGCGVYQIIDPVSAPEGIPVGSVTGGTTYIGDWRFNQSFINNTSVPETGLYGQAMTRFNAVQIGGGNAQRWYNGINLANAATVEANIDIEISLLTAAGGFYSNANLGGYAAWSPSLTAAEMARLTQFFDSVNTGLSRSAFSTSLLACGDSNTVGYEVTATERWAYLVASSRGLANNGGAEINLGVNSSTLLPYGALVDWSVQRPIHPALYPSPLTIIMLGTNDTGWSLNVSTFETEYSAYVARQIAGGIPASSILLISPVWGNYTNGAYAVNSTKLASFVAAVAAVAAANGTMYLDGYALTAPNSATWYGADNLHLNAAGHAGLAAGILSALTAQGF